MATGHAAVPLLIDPDTPKGRKGQVASHKRCSDLEQDTGFNTDVDKLDDNRRHAGNPLRRKGFYNLFFFSKRLKCMTETYLPEDLIEIDSDTPTPKGHKGQVAPHKRRSDPEQDTGFKIQMSTGRMIIGIMRGTLCARQVTL